MNKESFYIASIAQWLQCDVPNRKPDPDTKSGLSTSRYWFDNYGVVRESNHWFEVWRLTI